MRGVRRGDRVALLIEPSLPFVEALPRTASGEVRRADLY